MSEQLQCLKCLEYRRTYTTTVIKERIVCDNSVKTVEAKLKIKRGDDHEDEHFSSTKSFVLLKWLDIKIFNKFHACVLGKETDSLVPRLKGKGRAGESERAGVLGEDATHSRQRGLSPAAWAAYEISMTSSNTC